MRYLLLFVLVVIVGCGSYLIVPASPPPVGHSAAPFHPDTSGLHTAHDPGRVTGHLSGPCAARRGGLLPDRRCTPGSYDPAVTAARLCSPGYSTDSYRPPVSQTDHAKWDVVEPAYRQHIAGELDHLIPLWLGGTNSLRNLWVEAGSIPNPKDAVERALHYWVCAIRGVRAQARLRLAQAAIAHNWLTAVTRLGAS
jgi:hypothetical protein